MSIRSGFRRLLVAVAMTAPMLTLPVAHAQIAVGIGISVHVAPPVLPVYTQPALPAAGYLWTPGYWGYGDAAITGFPAFGCNRPERAFSGLPDIGALPAAPMDGTGAIGERTSASTAASTTASVSAESDSWAASGAVERSRTTARWPISAACT